MEIKTPRLPQVQPPKKVALPKLVDLMNEKSIKTVGPLARLSVILNSEPKQEWVKEHPFIKNHRYLPIDKVEYLLNRIFTKYRIEVLREGVMFNAVYVAVRVYVLNPVTGEMEYNDGVGACQLQTEKGASPADLGKINNGAVSMALPIAKTLAVKDACDHFGKIFGRDLNRRDVLPHGMDAELEDRYTKLVQG